MVTPRTSSPLSFAFLGSFPQKMCEVGSWVGLSEVWEYFTGVLPHSTSITIALNCHDNRQGSLLPKEGGGVNRIGTGRRPKEQHGKMSDFLPTSGSGMLRTSKGLTAGSKDEVRNTTHLHESVAPPPVGKGGRPTLNQASRRRRHATRHGIYKSHIHDVFFIHTYRNFVQFK